MEITKNETYNEDKLLDFLRSPQSIRSSCDVMLAYARKDELRHFHYKAANLLVTADFVIQSMLNRYPKLDIPYHSRMRHFEAEGIDRIALLKNTSKNDNATKSAIEVTLLSILLDAGAGMSWRYTDPISGAVLSKSEGLAVSSYNLFMQGLFSSDKKQKYQVDAGGLQNITKEDLVTGFQIDMNNYLIGLDGRLDLLQKLGVCLQQKTKYFVGQNGILRLGNLFDYWLTQTTQQQLSIKIIFSSLLDAFSEIWPSRHVLAGVNLGDVWPHSLLSTSFNPRGFIPFHKLTQWMCYSMVELLEDHGLTITDIDLLTGLPEYRNGGLFVDLKVLEARDYKVFNEIHDLDSEFVVEWRAMTVVLLDELADLIRAKLSLDKQQLPLIKILQGGTWLAGREIANKLRTDGSPPFKLASDGTIF